MNDTNISDDNFELFKAWLNRTVVPYYRMKTTGEDVDLWASDFCLRKVTIQQLNHAFSVWRAGPSGEFPPTAAGLLKIIYPPGSESAEEVAARKELSKLHDLVMQADSEIFHCKNLDQNTCNELNEKYGLKLTLKTYIRLKQDLMDNMKPRRESARNELQYYLSRANK